MGETEKGQLECAYDRPRHGKGRAAERHNPDVEAVCDRLREELDKKLAE